MLSIKEIEKILKKLLKKYNADYALLFGSYARGEATAKSDIDVVIIGGKNFIPKNIFSLAEDLREESKKDADVFEIQEINKETSFYEAIMKEAIKIA